MSRCFPFPPPGYAKVHVDKSLIESMKLQKDIKKAEKERRKKRKREKKKEKARAKEDVGRHEKHRDKKKGKGERNEAKTCPAKRPHAFEQLERSGVTEERDKPIIVMCSHGSTNSSDSTENSGCKRKRGETTADLSQNADHGTGFRIRLPLLKRKDSISLTTDGAQGVYCSTSGRESHKLQVERVLLKGEDAGPLRKEACQRGTCEPSTVVSAPIQDQTGRRLPLDLAAKSGVDLCEGQLSNRAETGTVPPAGDEKKKATHKHRSRAQKDNELFKKLIVEWRPPALQMEQTDTDDLGWLYEGKQPCRQDETKISKLGDGDVCRYSGNGPRAVFLPEADVWALPYVLPF